MRNGTSVKISKEGYGYADRNKGTGVLVRKDTGLLVDEERYMCGKGKVQV